MGYLWNLRTDETEDGRATAEWARTHASIIRTALSAYAERMQESADQAYQAYQAGQDSPVIKAAQDASMVTNGGFGGCSRLFADSAASARRALASMSEYLPVF
jgi:hypothetical protein